MSSESFLPPFSSDRIRPSRVRRKWRGRKARGRDRVALEALEPRTLLAVTTLPAVSVLSTPVLNPYATTSTNDPNNISDPSQNPNGNTNYNNASESSPTVVINQANPQKMVAVWTTYDPSHSTIPQGDVNGGRPLQASVNGAYSTDGGQTWSGFSVLDTIDVDPSVTPSTNDPRPLFTWITDASIAFDSNSQSFYVTYLEHSAASGSKAGELVLRKFDFSGSNPTNTSTSTIYSWLQPNTDPYVMGIYTPTIAVDGNVPSFTDTDSTGNPYTQTDPYTGNVYVAWVVQHALGANGTRLKTDIQVIASADGGNTFTSPVYANAENLDYNANTDNYTPQIAISQGRPANPLTGAAAIPGGQVSVIWDANTRNSNTDAIRINTAPGDVSGGLKFQGQRTVTTTGVRGTGFLNGSVATPANPLGVSPSPSITIDNTLGAYSPYQGYMYIAYVYHDPNNGNNNPNAANPDAIRLMRSTDGGTNWVHFNDINDDNAYTDGFSGGNKLYLMPSLAVDPTTGTLVASWYDGRYDPSHARLAMMVAASNDGGQSFSPNQFVNTALTARSGITNQTLVRGPLLDNQSGGAAESNLSYGTHQGLAVYGGKVFPVWAGNLDGNLSGNQKLDILTSQVRVSGGPRVVSSTMGPIGQSGAPLNTGRVSAGSPESANAAVGTPIFQQIEIAFDRPVAFNSAADPNAFDPSDVKVYYQKDTYDPITGALISSQFIPVPVGSITPLGTGAVVQNEASLFLINLAQAQTAVGVYTYTVSADLKDRIRTYNYAQNPAQTGTAMDQNADGSGGSASSDNGYSVPLPANQTGESVNPLVFPNGPYRSDMLPVVIPGPYISRTYTNSGSSLQKDGTVSSLYVQFDRFVDVSTFSTGGQFIDPRTNPQSPILRLMGPTGDMTGAAGGFKITPVDPDGSGSASTFRIDFKNPVAYSGTYTLQIASGVKTRPVGTAPAYGMDTNLNAGLDVFRGGQGATGETSTTVTQGAVGAGGVGPVPDAAINPVNGDVTGPGIGVFSLNFGQDFLIPQSSQIGNRSVLTVQLNILAPSDNDLTAILVAPDGHWITLFSRVTATGSGANFSNTVIDDNATANIQLGGAPFFGSYTPGGGVPDPSVLATLGLDPANYQASLTALASSVGHSGGTWKLAVIDNVKNGKAATVNAWSLSIQKPVLKSGMNEPVADQYTADFRIFTMDPTNPLASNTWTAVGPASDEITNRLAINTGSQTPADEGFGGPNSRESGPVTGLAFDPSDPSRNTVYVGGASGGLWKSTNFLSPGGPTYIPLTNFGPNNAINIGGIAVFGRNNDPNQSVVFAATGEGDIGSPGAGILRSTDGGATWQVLDSTSNVDAKGNLLPIDSPNRDHVFVGDSSYKVVVDPTATASGGIVVYVAMSGPNGGLWRSLDSGNHWALLRAGSCTDVALDPNSGRNVSNGLLQNVWAAFAGEGVYFSSTQGTGLQVVSGGVGSPFIQATTGGTRPLLVGNLTTNPNGASGRIVLAKPDLTGTPALDLAYQGWIYAAVVDTSGNFSGLYQTKDFGQNWVQLKVPMFNPPSGPQMPSNNTSLGDFNIGKGSGRQALSIAVDPQDPNVIYLGGSTSSSASGLIRVDATLAADAHAVAPYSATNPDGGSLLRNSTGPVSVANLNDPPTNFRGEYYYSLIHDPAQPFIANATLHVNNGYNTGNGVTSQFSNDGSGVTWVPFDIYTNGATTTGQHRMVTFTDPATGYTRLVIADDEGVFTTMDNHGAQVGSLGSYPVTASDRNGNIQITQLYYGAAQPDGSIFYGSAGSNIGGPQVADSLTTGNITGSGLVGNASGVAVDPQGLGTLFQYWNGTVVNPDGSQSSTDFFRVGGSTVSYGRGSTFGLIQNGGSGTADPQWPQNAIVNFAVNPLSGQQILISSTTGNIFTTQTQGVIWNQVASFGSQSMAMAYGAPDPSVSTGLGDFLYVGTKAGKINVSTDGGGTWTDISAGLDGSAVQSIVTNPTRGSHEAYAVTAKGVYHIADSTASGASWTKINGNLFNLYRNVFPNSTSSVSASTVDQNLQPYYLPVKPALAADNPGVTEMDLNISGHAGQTVGDLSVTLNSLQVTGPGASLGDLKIVLIAPDGTARTLFLQAGNKGTTLSNTTFSDLGSPLSQGSSPYSGSYQPADGSTTTDLSDFTGQYIDGTWKLLIYNSSTTTQGTLGNFSLYFSSGSSKAAGALTSLAVDWRYNLPDDPATPGTGPDQTHPALYVGGVGGVFRSFDNGQTWSLFPDGTTVVTGAANTTSANNSPLGDGGGMSSVQVSDLDMVLGRIDPTTGQPDISTGPNLLLASSYGQGQFAIRLAPITLPNQTGETPLLSIDHTDGYSDTGASSSDGITSNETPYITGYSEQTAYGNVVTVRLYDQTPNSPTFGQLVGIGQTDGFGKFRVQVCQYNPDGSKKLDASGNPIPVSLFTYNGQKVLGVQATDAAGTVGNMALVGNTLSPIFLELNAPNPATIVLAPGNDTGLDTDNITNPTLIVTSAPLAANGELTFNVTVDGSIQNGNITAPSVTLMRLNENGLYVPVASVPVPKTGTPNDPITVQVADPGPFQNGYAYTYAVQITDAQGNIYDPNGDPDPADLKTPHITTVIIDATPPVPGLLQLDPASDSGLNIGTSGGTVTPGTFDNITNPTLVNGKLVFDAQVGLADRGDTVILVRKDPLGNYTVLDTSATVASAVPDPQTGKIALTLTDPGPFGPGGSVADGTYTYYLKIVDIAGNSYVPQDDPARDTYSTSITVDTTPPDPNSILLRLDPASDSGALGDNRTDPTLVTPVNRLSFDIYLDPGDQYSLVTLYRDGRAVGTTSYASASPAIDPVTGQMKVKVVLTDPGPFTGGFPNPDGTYYYNYSVGVEDRAGNSSTGATQKITITTALPNQGLLALDPSSDTGLSNTDNITSPALSTSPSTPGTLQFHLTLDKNNSGQIANDTGATVYLLRSSDGGLTYNRVGSSVLTTKDPTSGLPVATLADPGPFTDGQYYYQVEVINKAGIDNKEAALPVLVTIDGTTPDPTSVGVTLDPTSDSGLNISVDTSTTPPTVTTGVSDGYTNPILSVAPSLAGTVDFTVTLALVDLGSQVTLMRSSDGGKTYVAVGTPALAAQVDADGHPYVVLTDAGLFGPGGTVADGTYLYSVRVEDIAGNTDDPSKTTPKTVVIDTTAPNPAGIALAPGSDTGLNTTDNVTNPQLASPAGQLGFTITLDAIDQNSLLTLYRDGVQVGSTVYATAAPSGGKVTATLVDPGPFANGTYTYTVGIVDRAGNADDPSKRKTLSVTINGITPSATSLTLDPGSDSADPSGRSSSDDYTNPALAPQNTGKLAFNVVLAPNDDGTQVTLLRDGSPVGTPVIAHLDPKTGQVTAQVIDPTPPSTGGTYVYSVALKDSAGNLDTDNPAYTRPTLSVTIDTSAPKTPSAPVLAPGSDSGYPGYTNDNLTNVNQPYFTGTAEANDLVQIVDSTGTLYGQAVADSKGIYTVQAGTRQADGSYTPLPDGNYVFYVRAYDLAGNPSARSGAGPQITINTVPITPQPTLKLVPGDDTGPGGPVSPSYFSDNITRVTTPHLQGTGKNGLTVQIIDVGGDGFNTVPGDVAGAVTNPDGSSTTLVQNGAFTFQIKQTLTDGKYKLVARTYDPATGTYSDSAPLVLTVMTGASLQAPSSFGLDPADDTGTKGDGATSTRLYRLTGHATPGTLVELVPDGGDLSRPIDTQTVGPDGTYTLRPQAVFVNGTITYRAYTVDIAGNLSKQYATATIRSTTTPGDFNGDGKADTMTFNPSTGVFSLTYSGSNTTVTQGPITYQGQVLSGPNMIPIQGDFNGDGKTDFGVYDFAHATYYIEESSLSGALNLVVKNYGWANHDLPLSADFDGDGITDFAVYRPDTSTFFARVSSSQADIQYQLGRVGDQPVVGDFNGDGATDVAVFRPSTAQWFIQPITVNASGVVRPIGLQTSIQFGWAGHDVPVAADFDGDGKTDVAVYRPVGSNAGQTQGQFYVRSSATGQTSVQAVGTAGQVTSSAIPTALDFNGDGKADPSVYQPSSSQWTFQLSGSAPSTSALGSASSLPVAAPLYPYLLPASFSPPRSTGGSVGKSAKPVSGDFNGDRIADVLTFNRANGVFSLTYSGTDNTVSLGPITYQGQVLSGPNMIPIQGDYNGDGITDFGVYDFAHATYYIEESSSTGTLDLVVKNYGWANHDLPLTADFNGDGITDLAVYRPDNATWYAQLSNGPAIQYAYGWANHDQPVIGDFNGDGTTDLAVFRPETAQWFIQPIHVTDSGQVQTVGDQTTLQFGWSNVDKAVAADFDGDGKTDVAVYRRVGPDPNQTQGQFYIRSSATGQTSVVSVGTPGQVAPNAIPTALDFNGDGKADPSVYQASSAQWTFQLSGSAPSTRTLGTANSLPAASPLSPYRLPSSSSLVATASVGGLTNFEAAPTTSPVTTSASPASTSANVNLNAVSTPVTASTPMMTVAPVSAPAVAVPVLQPQTASIGAGRMAQIRRLSLAQQRQARLRQALLARRAAQAANHQLVPGGMLALRARWMHRGF